MLSVACSGGCSDTGTAIFLKASNAFVHSSLSMKDEQPKVRTTSSATSNWKGRGEGGRERGRGERERRREREKERGSIKCLQMDGHELIRQT